MTSGTFGLLRPPRTVLFGQGTVAALGDIAATVGRRILVCTDPGLMATTHAETVIGSLRDRGLDVHVLDAAISELPLAAIDDAAQRARAIDPDCVVGFGGGSSLDLAKLVALALSCPTPLPSLYGENLVPRPILPVIAVPTTAGTGSEVTPVAVLSDPDRAIKVGIASPHLVPVAAVCDPDLTVGAPPTVTAYAGIDALAHAIEAYTARRYDHWSDEVSHRVFVGRNLLSDRFALHAVQLIAECLPGAVDDDPSARVGMLEGSLCAGLAFATAGTAAAHALQYGVGARTSTPHGLGVGLLLPYAMQFNRDVRAEEMSDLARAMNAGDSGDEAIDAVLNLSQRIGIPESLAALGVEREDLPYMADQAMLSQRLIVNNPQNLDRADAEAMLEAAWYGDVSRLSASPTR